MELRFLSQLIVNRQVFLLVNGTWKLGGRWDNYSLRRTILCIRRYLHLKPPLSSLNAYRNPISRATKKCPIYFQNFLWENSNAWFLFPEYSIPTQASVLPHTRVCLSGVSGLLSFLPKCHHTSSNMRGLWHLLCTMIYVPHQEGKMLPRNMWHATKCKMHSNFWDTKCEEKYAFRIEEIWSSLFKARLP